MTDSSSSQQSASKALTLIVSPGGTGTITVSNATVGQNLQVPITITLSPPPPSPVTLTITSSSPGQVLVGNPDDPGASGLSTVISADTTSVSTYVKALASSGTVNITVHIGGYTDGVGVVTLGQSGFVISSPNGVGASFTTFQGVSTPLTVYAARLNSNGTFAESQALRGTFSVNVPVASLDTSKGTVTPLLVPVASNTQSGTVTFQASSINQGTVTVALTTPDGFSTPGTGAQVLATVQQSGIFPCNPQTGVTVGKNLQTNCSVSLTSKAAANLTVTIASSDPSKLKFSTTPTGTTSGTITVTIPQNQSSSPEFYVHAFDSTGSVSYTVPHRASDRWIRR